MTQPELKLVFLPCRQRIKNMYIYCWCYKLELGGGVRVGVSFSFSVAVQSGCTVLQECEALNELHSGRSGGKGGGGAPSGSS